MNNQEARKQLEWVRDVLKWPDPLTGELANKSTIMALNQAISVLAAAAAGETGMKERLEQMKSDDYHMFCRRGVSHLSEPQWNWLIDNVEEGNG